MRNYIGVPIDPRFAGHTHAHRRGRSRAQRRAHNPGNHGDRCATLAQGGYLSHDVVQVCLVLMTFRCFFVQMFIKYDVCMRVCMRGCVYVRACIIQYMYAGAKYAYTCDCVMQLCVDSIV